jgi:hypothetical protein
MLDKVIKKYEGYLQDIPDASENEHNRWKLVIDALREKLERENVEQ